MPRRAVSAVDPQRGGGCVGGRVARLHFGQGATRLSESLERPGLAGPIGRGSRVGQAENAGRQAAGTDRGSATLWPAAFDAASAGSACRTRAAGDSRGFSGVFGGRAWRRSANCGGGRVRRDLELRGMAEVSRRPHAAIPTPVRSVVEIDESYIQWGRHSCLPSTSHFSRQTRNVCPTMVNACTSVVGNTTYYESRVNVSMPGPVEFPTSEARRCHPTGAASHQGWVFLWTHDAPTHFPGSGMEFISVAR